MTAISSSTWPFWPLVLISIVLLISASILHLRICRELPAAGHDAGWQ